MQKNPLSHAQLALAFVGAIALAAPGLYLLFAQHNPLLLLATVALVNGFEIWRKRRSAVK